MPSDRYAYYLEQSRIHHATSKTFSGNGVLKHTTALLTLAREIDAKSAIDYGCGKCNQYRQFNLMFDGKPYQGLEDALGFEVYKYDPAIKGHHKPPTEGADLVWCTDVLEHIPEEDIGWVVGFLFSLARKGLFVTVGNYPAKKHLPNGENAHVTVKPFEWWQKHFDEGQEMNPSVKLVLLLA